MRQLLSELDSRELSEWMAYETVEPFGAVRDNLHAGVVAATVANVNRAKGDKTFSPDDFLLQFGKGRSAGQEASVETMMAQMQMIAEAQNALAGPAGGGEP